MEDIIQNPGLQLILEKSLMCLDNISISAFRLVNQECEKIDKALCIVTYLRDATEMIIRRSRFLNNGSFIVNLGFIRLRTALKSLH